MREGQLDDRMGSEPVAGAYPDDGFLDDGFLDDGFLDDGFLDDGFLEEGFLEEGFVEEGFVEEGFVEEGGPGEAFVRDGMLVVPGGVVPTVPADGMPDWPPDVIPVALWPETTLRDALALGVPGAGLARVVAETTDPDAGLLGDLSDDALGDLVVASGRLQSWAAGLQARVVAERAARETNPLAHGSLVGQVTSELVVTEAEASEVVVRAESGADHPTVIAALVAARIDVRKAHTLLRSAAQLTVAERAEAITRFLPHAPRHTWKWLQARMLAFAKDRHGAGETARAEAQRRCVQLDRADNDMGWLTAYLPATDAAAVWGVVDDMAHQLRHTTGEDRTLSQLRADSLTGIVTGRLLPADRFTDTRTTTDPAAGTDPVISAGTTTSTTTGTDPATSTGTTTDPGRPRAR